MRLTIGSRRYDLATCALVMGVPGPPESGPPEKLLEQGADILEMEGPAGPMPVCVLAGDEAAVGRALSIGADLVGMSQPTTGSLRLCATAGVAVLVPTGAVVAAAAAGLPPERIVPDALLLDVTDADCPVAATAVGVIRGARIVRAAAADVRSARRVVDVLAAVMGAR